MRKTVAGLDGVDILLIVVLAMMYAAVAKLPFAPLKFGDGDFHAGAKVLASALHGQTPWSAVSIRRLPGAVFYYAIPYATMPEGSTDDQLWRAAFVWTTFWLGLCLLLIRRTAALIADDTAGIWAAALTLLSPASVYYTYAIMAESPGYLGAVVATYGFARNIQRGHGRGVWANKCLAVGGLSLLLLSRTNVVLLWGVAGAAAAVLWRRRDETSRRRAKFILATTGVSAIVCAVVTFAIGLLPQANRNLQNENLAYVALQGRYQYRTETWNINNWDGPVRKARSADWQMWHQRTEQMRGDAQAGKIPFSRVLYRATFSDVLHHPFINLKMSAVRALLINVAFVNSKRPQAFPRFGPISSSGTYALFHIAVNAAGIFLVLASVTYVIAQRQCLWEQWFLWGPWVGLMLFHCAVYAEPRYLLPAKPGLSIMAGTLLASVWQKYRSQATEFSQSPDVGVAAEIAAD